jgi:hypothetical protein
MQTPRYLPADVSFSLVRSDCDAGMDIRSSDQALAEGWTNIQFAPDLPMANYLELCPECRKAQDRAK